MKNKLGFILIFTFIFIATACSSDDTLSKEDVIAEIKQQIDHVESYHTSLDLSVIITDLASEQVLESNEGSVSANVIESTLESSGETTGPTGTTEHYNTDQASYVKKNDDAWQEGTEKDQPLTDDFSLYETIATIVVDLEDEEDVQMEENGNTYTFTFSGKSESIYEAFEDPYTLTLTGTTPGEMEQDMTIIVDKETFNIKEIKNSFSVEKEGAELVISIKQTYDQINKIDEIVIPEEVIDEATNETGHGNAQEQDAKMDVIASVEQRVDEVESYYMDVSLTINITDVETNETVDNSVAIEQVDIIEEPMESSGTLIEDHVTKQYYATTDATYVQADGQPWEDHSDQADLYDHSNMLYKDIAQILIDLKEDGNVQMIEKDGKYVFTFSGKSESVYNAFETPYSLSLTGATPDELEQTMSITVDRDTFFVEYVENRFVVEKDGHKLSILIEHAYEQMNEIDEISIPQEVIDEAI